MIYICGYSCAYYEIKKNVERKCGTKMNGTHILLKKLVAGFAAASGFLVAFCVFMNVLDRPTKE